ncbi:putative nucleic acid-binding protein [Leptolyngbya sp. PCC 7375]|nr:putative nucleic acid-binding protein [Leptolyngbya sp. PCC 7375]
MIVVSDTTPLSELAKVGHLDLLHRVYGEIRIPREVYDEVTTGNHPAIAQVKSLDWLRVHAVRQPDRVIELQNATRLGKGECAAMILAEEHQADQLLLDDLDARRVALSRNLPVVGTVGTLLVAKQRGVIDSVKDILVALIDQGTRISPRLYQSAIAAANESE